MLKRFRQIQIPILTKITIPYAILALLIAVGGSYIITNVIIDSVEERFLNQLIETALIASESVVRQEDNLLENLRLISHSQGMSAAISANQADDIRHLALPSAYNANLGAFIVINRLGQSLVALQLNEDSQIYDEMILDKNWVESEFVQRVLEGEVDEFGDKYGGLIANQSESFLFVAGPVINTSADNEISGVVLVGKSINEIVRLIREETLAQLTFYHLDGRPDASTLSEAISLESSVFEATLDRQEEGSISREITDNAIEYQELLSPFEIRQGEDIGILGVALPTSFLTQTTRITRDNTLILMAVILLLVILVGVYVAGVITRPILDLKEAAMQVSAGNLNVRVKSTGRDEISVLAKSFNEMVGNVSQSKKDLIDAYEKTIEGWAMALDLRDHETEGHSRRVTEMAVELAQRFGVKGEALENLRRGSLLHDIGKIGISDSILLKEGSLTDDEYENMKQHPVFAQEFMGKIEFLASAMDIPYSHHEKWDGSGYPQGLKGEEIPTAARIFSIVDVWDAITKDRPYRKAMTFVEAIKVIEDGRGSHFDPLVTDEFLALMLKKVKEVA